MRSFLNNQSLYEPIQPAVKTSDKAVSYLEWLPDIRLRNYIYCYWSLQTTSILEDDYRYRIVSDGCIDVFIDLINPDEVYIMGLQNSYTECDLSNQFNYIGIRFLPGIFPLLFNVDASELRNSSICLSLVQKDLYQNIQSELNFNSSIFEICEELNNYFNRLVVQNNLCFDIRFCKAFNQILMTKGQAKIETDLNDGISSRHLRRLFQFYIGDTAKVFSKVVRFQSFLRADPSVSTLKNEKMFYDFGYYDQTHFIKEFKQFYGLTPTLALDK